MKNPFNEKNYDTYEEYIKAKYKELHIYNLVCMGKKLEKLGIHPIKTFNGIDRKSIADKVLEERQFDNDEDLTACITALMVMCEGEFEDA